jgi:hypothetical protein
MGDTFTSIHGNLLSTANRLEEIGYVRARASCWDVRRTLEGVFEMVGWRGRAERGVKAVEIGVSTLNNHVKQHRIMIKPSDT